MYSRPQLDALVQRVRDDLISRLTTDDVLRRADAEVYARVVGGVANGLYGFIDWLSKQIIYDTADVEILERWCSIWGITRKPAAVATGSVTITVQAGAVVPAGTLMQALDGVQYKTTADATGVVPTLTAPVASVIAAAAGNRPTGQTLTMVSPISGVTSAVLAGALSGGADIETDDALRARFITRIQNPPHGGNKSDYLAWALAIPGVTRAWVYPLELGLGTVTVRFMRDNEIPAIPDAGEVATVQAALDLLRPVTAQLTVVAPAAVPQPFSIALTPNTAAVQAAVNAELDDLILREATPGGTLLLSHIRAAISAAAGENNYVMTVPNADVVSTTGNITTRGAMTWL